MRRSAQRLRNLRPRYFERNSRVRSDLVPGGDAQPPGARRYEYERLMSVEVRSGYFDGSDGAGPVFFVQPTRETADLMARLGLIFRPGAAGFSVIYDVRQTDKLLAFLRRQWVGPGDEDSGDRGVWTRLTFLLVAEDPYFVSTTDLPLGTDPTTANFYFDNRQAHDTGDGIALQPGETVKADELLPVAPTEITVPVLPGATFVQLVNVSDVVRLEVEIKGQDRVYLDSALVPQGLYRIRQIFAGGGSEDSPPLLDSGSSPVPIGLLDLFFTDPTFEGRGIFPVRHLFEPNRAEIVSTLYRLSFGGRSSFWVYYIVPGSGPWIWDLLWILSVDDPQITFAGPVPVELADGRPAYRFVSNQTLPVLAASPFRFELWGETDGQPLAQRLVRRLPVAAADAVQPLDVPVAGDPAPAATCSKIFVAV